MTFSILRFFGKFFCVSRYNFELVRQNTRSLVFDSALKTSHRCIRQNTSKKLHHSERYAQQKNQRKPAYSTHKKLFFQYHSGYLQINRSFCALIVRYFVNIGKLIIFLLSTTPLRPTPFVELDEWIIFLLLLTPWTDP